MDKRYLFEERDFDLKSRSDLPAWVQDYPEYYIQLKELRKRMDITQAKLAESIGMTWRSIPNIESGRVNPKISTLKKIAESLNTELFILLIPKKLPESPTDNKPSPKHETEQKAEIISKTNQLNETIAHNEDPSLKKEDIFFFD